MLVQASLRFTHLDYFDDEGDLDKAAVLHASIINGMLNVQVEF